jgi:CRP-like cAMP-binding protein
VILDLVTTGSLIGELSAIDGQPRSASAVSITPVEVLVLHGDDFRAFLEREPKVTADVLRTVGAKLRLASQRQLAFGADDSLTRICRCLLVMVEQFGAPGDGSAVTLPISQQDLASLTGLSREAVVKGLRRLRELGWVEASGRNIVIRDSASVELQADS